MTLARALVVVLVLSGCGGGDAPADPETAVKCVEGFEPDGARCKPILAEGCDRTSIATPGDRACRAIGVTACAKGFDPDEEGGCRAVLPAMPCALGNVALPGEVACREIAPCGAGKWGDPEAGAIYVDHSFVGGDGTEAKPFATIGAAIAAADGAKNPTIAIAEGIYPENLAIDKRVRLVGRCPRLVEVKGVATAPTLSIGADVEIRDLAITGAGRGVQISRGSVRLSRVWLHDTGDSGVWAEKPITLAIEDSLIERTTFMAVGVYGSVAALERSIVRDTQPRADKNFGYGVYGGPDGTRGSKVTLRSSVISRNRATGVAAYSSSLTIEGSLVEATQPRLLDRQLGSGVIVDVDRSTKIPSELAVTGSVIAQNQDVSVIVHGSRATLRSSVVRDTQPNAADKSFGHGLETNAGSEVTIESCLFARNVTGGIVLAGTKGTITSTIVRDTAAMAGSSLRGTGGHGLHFTVDPAASVPSDVVVRDTLVTGNHSAGVNIIGSRATLEGSVVEGTRPRPRDGAFGRGIELAAEGKTMVASELVLQRSVVRDNYNVGLFVFGSHATVGASVVRDTHAREIDGKYGDGIQVSIGVAGTKAFPDASLTMTDSVVDGNARAGISVFGAQMSVARSSLACNAIDLDIEPVAALDGEKSASVEDEGGNVCGCGIAAKCEARSTGLEPTDAPG